MFWGLVHEGVGSRGPKNVVFYDPLRVQRHDVSKSGIRGACSLLLPDTSCRNVSFAFSDVEKVALGTKNYEILTPLDPQNH